MNSANLLKILTPVYIKTSMTQTLMAHFRGWFELVFLSQGNSFNTGLNYSCLEQISQWCWATELQLYI